jgi:CubicO group peptidase (beta-lactamase class C family)
MNPRMLVVSKQCEPVCSRNAGPRLWTLGALLAALLAAASLAAAEEISPAQFRAAAAYSAARRGFSLLVMQHGKIIFEDYPNRNTASEPHKIYSGTKGFWVLAALKAVEEGIIKLDEPVTDTIPEWRGDAGKGRITIRHLLNFTSGIDAANHLHGDGIADRNRIALQVPQVAPCGRAFIYGPAALQVFHEVLRRKLALREETPTHYLERKVLAPLDLGPQRYMADGCANPLLATGFKMTAREWARMGSLILQGGAPVLPQELLQQCFHGTGVNPAFGFGFWNNQRAGHWGAREFDIEDMLERSWQKQNWRNSCICRDAPPDLVASVGSGYQRLFVIPSLELVVVRQGVNAKFSDGDFLRLLLGKS